MALQAAVLAEWRRRMTAAAKACPTEPYCFCIDEVIVFLCSYIISH